MKLRKLFTFIGLLLMTVTTTAQQMPELPVDTAVRIGKLDNGLTYYIRYNNWPEDRAEFFIAQKVGAIQEEDNQRGLAHFLEHMCFNGTEHFPGNGVIRYCESIGVQFGRDLNAYTSIDETVYNISNVPTTRQSALDSCLLILYDWANALTLDPTEIDKERSVIHEEWRLHLGANMRMLERALPKLYPGCKYGYRLPIGTMEVIDNFPHQALRDYYEKWYRPDNQAIIVVGDIDVDYTEKKIKELFAGIEMPVNPAPVVVEPVPATPEPIVVVEKDKEQQYNIVEVMFKHEPLPDAYKNTPVKLMMDYMQNVSVNMLNDRLAEVAKKPDAPFVQAGAGDGTYLLSKPMDAFMLYVVPKDGQTDAAVSAVYREALRAARHGFTATEYSRAKANVLSALDKTYSNKDKRYSNSFCQEYKEHFLDKEPIPSIDYTYMSMTQMIPMIPLDNINQLIREYVSEKDSNLVILSLNNEKEGAVYPTEAGLLKAVRDVRGEEIAAYVDNVKNEPLITKLPTPGKIKKEVANEKFGYKTITLANGITVRLKHTDYKKDQVILYAEAQGGQSMFGQEDFINLKVLNDVIEASGLGNFSHTELEKALAGKIAGVSFAIDETQQYLSGSSTPKDVETMLQLAYLYFTKINKDQEGFDNVMKQYEITLKNKAISPDAAFSDSLNVTMNSHNPRFAPITFDDLKHVNYDRCLEMAAELLTNASAYTFTIIGNYDEATIRPLLEQYLGSLRSTRQIMRGQRIDTDAKGIVVNKFLRKMEVPKAMGVVIWSSDKQAYTAENIVKADMAGQILDMVFTKKIREDAGATYSVGTRAGISRVGTGTPKDKISSQILVVCPLKPEKADLALNIMREELEAMTKTCDEAMLAKVKEYMLKAFDDRTKTNNYWNRVISNETKFGVDIHTDYKAIVERQTTATISAFVKELLSAGNRIEVVMLPE